MIMFTRTFACIVAIGLLAGHASAKDFAERYRSDIQPILTSKCKMCHGGSKQEAEIKLTGDRTAEQLADDPHLWFRVLEQLEFNQMPPKDEDQLTTDERAKIMGWIKGDLTDALTAKRKLEGRAKFRRLSRAEFANTFEDLFGYRPDVGLMPQDGRVNGYTKVASALPLSSDGAYGYIEIAEQLAGSYIMRAARKDDQRVIRAEALPSGESKGHLLVLDDGWIVSFNSDLYSGRVNLGGVRTPGWYKLRMHVYGYQTDQPLPFGVYVGSFGLPPVTEFAAMATAPPGKPTIVETEVYLDRGNSLRLVPLGLGVPVPKNHQASKCKAPGLAVQFVELEGPELPMRGDRWLTADLPEDLRTPHPRLVIREKGGYSYNKITHEQFVELMRKTVRRVGARLFRRDLTEQEVEARLDIVREGLKQERTVQGIFQDVCVDLLTAPEFFCVIESPGKLSDFALASRLAYFLWNSTPDDELVDLARQGRLSDPAILRQQTDRLLDDPRSARFVADFLDQWLKLHAIDDTMPDKRLYPEYNDLLKYSSLYQTRRTFEQILRENRSVREFVAPKSVLVNEALAEHYGLPRVIGAELRAVDLPKDSPFGGLWTQPLVLKVTANGSNTSPVTRGVFIAERLLGTEISPPPPNIEPINPDTRGATTVREQLALHSSEGACAHCHKKFDPYGFALESFDVMGQHRATYRVLTDEPRVVSSTDGRKKRKVHWTDGQPVDPSGVMPEGNRFVDVTELRSILAQQPERLARGVTQHLLTYATTTPTGPLDRKAVDDIVASAADEAYGLRSIVHGIVQSELFRWK